MFDRIYKEKYKLIWCNICDCAVICCSKCKNSSCNGGGCEECNVDFDEFKEYKNSVKDYLTPEEKVIYQKCLRLKEFILDSIEKDGAIF